MYNRPSLIRVGWNLIREADPFQESFKYCTAKIRFSNGLIATQFRGSVKGVIILCGMGIVKVTHKLVQGGPIFLFKKDPVEQINSVLSK